MAGTNIRFLFAWPKKVSKRKRTPQAPASDDFNSRFVASDDAIAAQCVDGPRSSSINAFVFYGCSN